MNEIKIKGKEIFFFLTVIIPPLLLLFIPTYAAIYKGTDAWIIFVIVGVIDVLLALITARTFELSEGKTLVQLLQVTFGSVAGRIFSVLFLTVFAYKAAMYFRDSLEFIFMSTYTLEPIFYFAVPMIFLDIFGQFQKKENVLRICNIIFAVMAVTYFFLLLSAVKSFDIKRLMPVLEDGVADVASAVPHFFTWTGNIIVLYVFFDKLKQKSGIGKYILLGTGVAYGIVIILTVLFIGVFGKISGFMTSSVLELSLYLDSEVFFSNLESLIKVLWAFGIFARDCVFITATVETFSELFKITDRRIINIVIPLLLTVPTFIIFTNEETYFYFTMGAASIVCGVLQYSVPLLLWTELEIKRMKKRTSE